MKDKRKRNITISEYFNDEEKIALGYHLDMINNEEDHWYFTEDDKIWRRVWNPNTKEWGPKKDITEKILLDLKFILNRWSK